MAALTEESLLNDGIMTQGRKESIPDGLLAEIFVQAATRRELLQREITIITIKKAAKRSGGTGFPLRKDPNGVLQR
jgi:hypothetical protein